MALEYENASLEAHSKWNISHHLYTKLKHLKLNKMENHTNKRSLLTTCKLVCVCLITSALTSKKQY